MLIRLFSIAAIVCAAFLCGACEESQGPDLTKNRYMYYAVGGTSAPGEAGFYRYSLSDGSRVQLDGKSAEYCTRVAANGIVLFDSPGLAHRLYGVCEDGYIVPVPFPESSDPRYGFVYAMPPHIELAANGHHAVYAADLTLEGVPDPADGKSHLVLFDCLRQRMTMIDADSVIREAMALPNAGRGRIAGEHLFISPGGNFVWFSAVVRDNTAQANALGYALVEWSAGKTRLLQPVASGAFELLGYNAYLQSLTFRQGGQAQTLFLGAMEVMPFDAPDTVAVHPWQFGSEGDICVRWEEDGISIRRASNGELVWRVLDRLDFESKFGEAYTYTPDNYIGISPDGRWLALTLTRETQPGLCDLFAVRDNGEEIIRVAKAVPHGFPMISPEVPQ